MDPLIVSPTAQRRLKALLGHSRDISEIKSSDSLRCQRNVCGENDRDRSEDSWTLAEAHVLRYPIGIPADGDVNTLTSINLNRDISCDMGMSGSYMESVGVSF